jgi:hypothetical protein
MSMEYDKATEPQGGAEDECSNGYESTILQDSGSNVIDDHPSLPAANVENSLHQQQTEKESHNPVTSLDESCSSDQRFLSNQVEKSRDIQHWVAAHSPTTPQKTSNSQTSYYDSSTSPEAEKLTQSSQTSPFSESSSRHWPVVSAGVTLPLRDQQFQPKNRLLLL